MGLDGYLPQLPIQLRTELGHRPTGIEVMDRVAMDLLISTTLKQVGTMRAALEVEREALQVSGLSNSRTDKLEPWRSQALFSRDFLVIIFFLEKNIVWMIT